MKTLSTSNVNGKLILTLIYIVIKQAMVHKTQKLKIFKVSIESDRMILYTKII